MSKASFYHHATGYAGVFFSGKFQHRNPQKRTPGAERESLPPDSLSKHPNADGKQTKALRRAHRRGLQLTDKRTPAPRRQRCCEAAVSQPCRVYGATRCTTGPRTSKDQLSHPPRERSPGNTRARLKWKHRCFHPTLFLHLTPCPQRRWTSTAVPAGTQRGCGPRRNPERETFGRQRQAGGSHRGSRPESPARQHRGTAAQRAARGPRPPPPPRPFSPAPKPDGPGPPAPRCPRTPPRSAAPTRLPPRLLPLQLRRRPPLHRPPRRARPAAPSSRSGPAVSWAAALPGPGPTAARLSTAPRPACSLAPGGGKRRSPSERAGGTEPRSTPEGGSARNRARAPQRPQKRTRLHQKPLQPYLFCCGAWTTRNYRDWETLKRSIIPKAEGRLHFPCSLFCIVRKTRPGKHLPSAVPRPGSTPPLSFPPEPAFSVSLRSVLGNTELTAVPSSNIKVTVTQSFEQLFSNMKCSVAFSARVQFAAPIRSIQESSYFGRDFCACKHPTSRRRKEEEILFFLPLCHHLHSSILQRGHRCHSQPKSHLPLFSLLKQSSNYCYL